MEQRFAPNDVVAWLPLWSDEVQVGTVVAVEGDSSVTVQFAPDPGDDAEDAQQMLNPDFGGELLLLAPARRPILDDVLRAIRNSRSSSVIGGAVRHYFIEQARRSTGDEDDDELVAILRAGRKVRDDVANEVDASLLAIGETLRAEYGELTSEAIARRWAVERGRWNETAPGDAYHDLSLRQALFERYPLPSGVDADAHLEQLYDAAQAMRERCDDAAERLGTDWSLLK